MRFTYAIVSRSVRFNGRKVKLTVGARNKTECAKRLAKLHIDLRNGKIKYRKSRKYYDLSCLPSYITSGRKPEEAEKLVKKLASLSLPVPEQHFVVPTIRKPIKFISRRALLEYCENNKNKLEGYRIVGKCLVPIERAEQYTEPKHANIRSQFTHKYLESRSGF